MKLLSCKIKQNDQPSEKMKIYSKLFTILLFTASAVPSAWSMKQESVFVDSPPPSTQPLKKRSHAGGNHLKESGQKHKKGHHHHSHKHTDSSYRPSYPIGLNPSSSAPTLRSRHTLPASSPETERDYLTYNIELPKKEEPLQSPNSAFSPSYESTEILVPSPFEQLPENSRRRHRVRHGLDSKGLQIDQQSLNDILNQLREKQASLEPTSQEDHKSSQTPRILQEIFEELDAQAKQRKERNAAKQQDPDNKTFAPVIVQRSGDELPRQIEEKPLSVREHHSHYVSDGTSQSEKNNSQSPSSEASSTKRKNIILSPSNPGV